ncbi:ABC transporter ATP-binding protein [Reinekea marinisedimentorum]|uniref:ATP-binding cassette subfamily B multidrug efflux pump n=1 Tax=Reinekea marinisedimentorum TaxID=230495 RepID=A0A4R3HYX1_9GAMM|nr:ABC transporter ATP-binding protein [Reinekea marinisedimentorum]TCS36699.1 ATP-binding cassette subfamily B multidrug efflux pump [Reinekea marinisedimentorum]
MLFLDGFISKVKDLIDPYSDSGIVPASGVIRYLLDHTVKLRSIIILSILLTIVTASVEVYLVQYAGRLIDILSEASPLEVWMESKGDLLWASFFILLLRPISHFARNLINLISFQCNSTSTFRWSAYQYTLKQPICWFQKDMTGRVASRLFSVGNYATDIIFHSLNVGAFALVYLVGIIIMLGSITPTLTIPIILWFVFYIWLLVYTIPRAIKTNLDFQNAKSSLMGRLVDRIANIETVAFFCSIKESSQDYKNQLEEVRDALFVAKSVQLFLKTMFVLLEGCMLVGFVGYGIWLWSQGLASIGMVGVSLALSFRISSLAEMVFDAVWIVFERVGSLKEALATISQPLEIEDAPNADRLKVNGAAISLNNVSHKYGLGSKGGGVNNLSLSISAKEKIAIVGRSGAGKSTLINIIMRVFDAESGTVHIDNQDITSVTQESLRDSFSVVSQQTNLLNSSVLYNITLGKSSYSLEDIVLAAKKAKAHDFIMELKDAKGRVGYEAHIGERGVKLSGGQRQRLALARALFKDSKILILDEATSALDSEVEFEIQEALKAAMLDKTVIAIAHRLSTITQMDRIIVMDKGNIVEQGTHQSLLSQDSLYSKYWLRQTGGFDILEDNPSVGKNGTYVANDLVAN